MGRSSLANSISRIIIRETAKQIKKGMKNHKRNSQKRTIERNYNYNNDNNIQKASFQESDGIETVHLETIDGFEFEKMCELIFSRIQNNRVERTPLVGDLGKDLIIHSDDGKIFVECKHHLDRTIGRPVIQKLHSAVISEGVIKGIVITSGHFSKGAIEYATKIHPPVELLDKHLLYDLASRAGIKLKTNVEFGSVYTYPITNEKELKCNISDYIEQYLISIPNSIKDNIKISKRKTCLKPIFFAKYDINSVIGTNVGIIYSENDNGTVFISGIGGNPIDEEITQHFIGISPINLISRTTNDVDVLPFKLLSNHAKNEFVEYIKNKYARNVSYVGRNNVSYTKDCIPKNKDIFISNIKQIYMPESEIDFNLMGRKRYFKIADNGTPDFYIFNEDISKCEICNRPLNKKGILCNDCGSISHDKSFFSSHGFYCKNCGKSICRRCTRYYSKFLLFKVFLCEECSKQEKQNGRKIKKMKI